MACFFLKFSPYLVNSEWNRVMVNSLQWWTGSAADPFCALREKHRKHRRDLCRRCKKKKKNISEPSSLTFPFKAAQQRWGAGEQRLCARQEKHRLCLYHCYIRFYHLMGRIMKKKLQSHQRCWSQPAEEDLFIRRLKSECAQFQGRTLHLCFSSSSSSLAYDLRLKRGITKPLCWPGRCSKRQSEGNTMSYAAPHY